MNQNAKDQLTNRFNKGLLEIVTAPSTKKSDVNLNKITETNKRPKKSNSKSFVMDLSNVIPSFNSTKTDTKSILNEKVSSVKSSSSNRFNDNKNNSIDMTESRIVSYLISKFETMIFDVIKEITYITENNFSFDNILNKFKDELINDINKELKIEINNNTHLSFDEISLYKSIFKEYNLLVETLNTKTKKYCLSKIDKHLFIDKKNFISQCFMNMATELASEVGEVIKKGRYILDNGSIVNKKYESLKDIEEELEINSASLQTRINSTKRSLDILNEKMLGVYNDLGTKEELEEIRNVVEELKNTVLQNDLVLNDRSPIGDFFYLLEERQRYPAIPFGWNCYDGNDVYM